MREFLNVIVPLFALMLMPVWVPIIAATAGAVLDRCRPRSASPAQRAIEEAKVRSAAFRERRDATLAEATA